MTAFFDSRLSVFKITPVGVAIQDISPYIVSLDFPTGRRLYPVTALGSTGDAYAPGLYGSTITMELMWSDDATLGPDTIFRVLRDHTAATAYEYYPEGGSSPKYSGNCWVEDYVIHTRVNNLLMATVTLKTDGAINDA